MDAEEKVRVLRMIVAEYREDHDKDPDAAGVCVCGTCERAAAAGVPAATAPEPEPELGTCDSEFNHDGHRPHSQCHHESWRPLPGRGGGR